MYRNERFSELLFVYYRKSLSKCVTCVLICNSFGQIAQSVEQRTENPCVGSSILPLATKILN